MGRVTRSHTIARHLVAGGFTDLDLSEAVQKAGPDGHDVDGFSLRQHRDGDTLVVIAGAFGPDWFRTLSEVAGRLESPHIGCTVDGAAPELADHEVLVRWATSAELQERKAAEAKRQAGLREMLRAQDVKAAAEERRQELEAAGQSGLF